MFAPHTITIFNSYMDMDGRMNYTYAILTNTLLDTTAGKTKTPHGDKSANEVKAYIPFDVVTDKLYVSPKTYEESIYKSNLWTVRDTAQDFIILGAFAPKEGQTRIKFEEVKASYDKCYRIKKVSEYAYGSKSMQHWEIGCE